MRVFVFICAVLFGTSVAWTQSLIPSIDTMPPVLSRTSLGCGVYEFTATDTRNIPDPPTDPPRANDQVETGIASISISDNPRSDNARLTLVTDVQFPRVNAYKRFVFRVEPIDKTKRATVYLFVRDHASNLASQQLVIEPSLPQTSVRDVTMTLRVGRRETRTITLTNSTTAAQTVQSIVLQGSLRMSILSGGTTPLTIQAGSTHDVVIAYDPTLASEAGDEATLIITTACGSGSVAVRGVGLVGRLITEDWNAGQRGIGVRACKAGGFVVKNEGTIAVTITGFTSSEAAVEVTTNITAANPLILNPGNEFAVTELCYTPAAVGVVDAIVSVVSDADDGDVECIVKGEGVVLSSVDDDGAQSYNPRYDRASDAIVVGEFEGQVSVFSMLGNTFSVQAISGRISAENLAPGMYYLALKHPVARVVPVLILR